MQPPFPLWQCRKGSIHTMKQKIGWCGTTTSTRTKCTNLFTRSAGFPSLACGGGFCGHIGKHKNKLDSKWQRHQVCRISNTETLEHSVSIVVASLGGAAGAAARYCEHGAILRKAHQFCRWVRVVAGKL